MRPDKTRTATLILSLFAAVITMASTEHHRHIHLRPDTRENRFQTAEATLAPGDQGIFNVRIFDHTPWVFHRSWTETPEQHPVMLWNIE